jgi:hypothetical protein
MDILKPLLMIVTAGRDMTDDSYLIVWHGGFGDIDDDLLS